MQNEGRFGAATDEQMVLAREIAADFYAADADPEFNLFAPCVRAGKHDGDEAVQCALRAIQMTTELAATWLDDQSDKGAEIALTMNKGSTARVSYGGGSLAIKRAATALRTNDHLKGHPQ